MKTLTPILLILSLPIFGQVEGYTGSLNDTGYQMAVVSDSSRVYIQLNIDEWRKSQEFRIVAPTIYLLWLYKLDAKEEEVSFEGFLKWATEEYLKENGASIIIEK